eukprot:CAMPEP_0197443166 /NCGR_PEP_ID=MMETSP1175-20131217/8985_1 /TAXON_ID=1003142 /ORGANISM="Triceratium dubium, Strain CCMP147" /LENGTH=632 /DNA_ID=CAMNT_0042973763 /DNA_START=174 /DNA_END=2072 /DNA_ORIENTATION=+
MPRAKKLSASQAVANKSVTAERRVEMKIDAKDTFPSKTYDVIEHCDQHDPGVASWDNEGTAFIIKDVSSLEQFYLPKKFDHSNFQSFVRQLNLYGFRNVSKEKEGSTSGDLGAVGPGHIVFKNDNFKRGRRDLLANIRRSKKGDRTQRKTRQEEELHSVCDALNKRFDQVDMEVKSLHVKMDLLSSRLDKVLNLLLDDRSRVGGRNDDHDDNGNGDRNRHQDHYSGKKRRLEGEEGGPGDDDGGAHSVSASEASKDGGSGYLPTASFSTMEREHSAGRVSADGSVTRNVSPACSGTLTEDSLFPVPSVNSRASSAEKSRNSSGGFTETEIGVVGDENDAVKFDRDLLAACETILENSMDEEDGSNRRSNDGGISPVGVRMGPHTSQGGGAEESSGAQDISALDAMPLNLDGFDDIDNTGGSSSLSGEDDILISYEGTSLEPPPGVAPNLQVATVYDHGGNAGGGGSDISFRRGGGRKFLSHRTIMAGITLMSVIAAVAVGTAFSVSRQSQDSTPGNPRDAGVAVDAYAEDVAATPPCLDCTNMASPGAGTMSESEMASPEAGAMSASGKATAEEEVGLMESTPKDWDEAPRRVSPTPAPTLIPSYSRRHMAGYWNNLSPSSEPSTEMRTIRF